MTPSKRVALLGSFPPDRGISAYCIELARALGELVLVECIGFKHMYPGFLYPGGNLKPDNSLPTYESGTVRIRRNLTWYNPFTWLWEGVRTRGEVLHVQFWSLPLVPVFLTIMLLYRIRRIPCVLTIHNLESHEQSFVFRIALRAMIALSNAVIVHTSRNVQQAAVKYRSLSKKVRCIPHGVLRLFSDAGISRADARAALALPPEARVALFFGAIREYKGLDTLLRSFETVSASIPDAMLLVVGKLWEPWERYAAIIQQAGLGNRVKPFLDYIPASQVKQFFVASDLVVLPYSRFDAQSGVAMTALAFAKPMVVTDVGGLGELVQDAERIVNAGDVDALSRSITDTLRDKQKLERLCDESRQLAERYSWDAIARKTLGVYGDVNGVSKERPVGLSP